MAQLLGPDHPDVEAATPETRRILGDLAARPALARLDAALGRRERAAGEERVASGATRATAPG